MLAGAIIAAFLLPIIYIIIDAGKKKSERERELEVIQRKLAENEAKAKRHSDDNESK